MDYELRKLGAEDLFTMFNIMTKIGFKQIKESMTQEKISQIVKAFNQEKKEDEENNSINLSATIGFNVVFDVLGIIVENLPKCKNEIYKLLSDLSGIKVKDIAALDMVTFTQMIVDVLKKEEFKDFFKVVSGLFK